MVKMGLRIFVAFAGVLWSGFVFGASAYLGAPIYKYVLVVNHDPDLCKHMEGVFNRDFTHLWDSGPQDLLLRSENQPVPALFPPLPGVEQNREFARTVWHSRYPSSSEFDAINWQLGQMQSGPTVPAEPILVAHFDFDNDGQIDTVAKIGFTRGYGDLTNPNGTNATEYLYVWRSRPDVTVDPASLSNEVPQDRPSVVTGGYMRPFIYKGRVYVARYGLHTTPNRVPEREWMLVGEFKYTGALDPVLGNRPALHESFLCRFQMIDLRNERKSE